MCTLYKVDKSAAEVAGWFRARAPQLPLNVPDEVYPGYPGLVVRERDGERVLEQMTWGFPLRLKGMKPNSQPKPVNNIADLRKPFWSPLARKPQWRCLIPVTHFCEAEGPKGRKTRTWLYEREQPIFAWGGLWRNSDEGGPVYSGAMADCNETVRPIHTRMPVILRREDWETWLHGSFEDICARQGRCYPDELIGIQRTAEPWHKRA
jgi:putative SOS response-associated peptidase YedK